VERLTGLYIPLYRQRRKGGDAARDRAGILLVSGLLSVFCFPAPLQQLVVVGFLPITGIPLPFSVVWGVVHAVQLLATGMILGWICGGM